jgi:Concanavalin A-like lectin/glucanases superfamily
LWATRVSAEKATKTPTAPWLSAPHRWTTQLETSLFAGASVGSAQSASSVLSAPPCNRPAPTRGESNAAAGSLIFALGCKENLLGVSGEKCENDGAMATPSALLKLGGLLDISRWRRSALPLLRVAVAFCILLPVGAVAQVPMDAVEYWKFDEGSGTAALDSSTNGHIGTIQGASYVPGISNYALAFNGSNTFVFASDTVVGGTSGAGLDIGTRDWTVAAWIKTTGSGMVVTKMGWIGGNNPDGWGMSVSANGTLGAVLHKSNVGTLNIFAGDGNIVNDGRWHHVGVVFNRSANMVRYVDGASTGTQNDLTFLGGQSIDNTKQLRIGARDQAGDEIFFNGLIDDARIYARALSPAEIASLAGVEPPPPPVWSPPVSLVSAYGRLALGNRVHVVGHYGDNLVYRSSTNNGATWSSPSTVAPASVNYPMQYGGLFASGDTVYLLTAAGDMGAYSQPLDFRKSTNNGATWSSPIRITLPGQEIRRANIMASGNAVHVFGGQSDANGYGTGVYYFRSTNGGANWDPGVRLFAEADASARMAVDGTNVHISFGAKVFTNSFGGRTTYMRSTNNGASWGPPIFIGENTPESDVQARQQIAAAEGRVFSMWQRERPSTGGALPTARLGYNRSTDSGTTWQGLQLLPGDQILSTDTNVIRDHHQIWMTSGGELHIAWAHGPPGDPSTPMGYILSPDYGATWATPEIAISSYGGGVPDGIVADDNWVHLLAEPGVYVRRRLAPIFRSIRHESQSVVLEWTGQGTLQWSENLRGPWTDLSSAGSPQSVAVDSAQRFFRLIAQ